MSKQLPYQRGFTLIELSIVLVIIGLITGSVLVGRDLIKAAAIRAAVSQMERYNAAVHTFQTKFDNNIPGDMSATDAQRFGLFPGPGNNNGIIDADGTINGVVVGSQGNCGEATVFWRHLSDAGMIEGSYGVNGAGALDPATGYPTAMLGGNPFPLTSIYLFIPQSKMGGGMFVLIRTAGNFVNYTGVNYGEYYTSGLTSMSQAGWGASLLLTPHQVRSVDVKMDDGMPFTGRVQSTSGVGGWAATPTAGVCVYGVALTNPTDQYNIVNGNGDIEACGMKVAIQ